MTASEARWKNADHVSTVLGIAASGGAISYGLWKVAEACIGLYKKMTGKTLTTVEQTELDNARSDPVGNALIQRAADDQEAEGNTERAEDLRTHGT